MLVLYFSKIECMLKNLTKWNLAHLSQRIHRNCRQLQTFFFFVPGIPGFVQRHDEEQTCSISKKWNTIGDKLASDVQLTNVDQIPGSG